MILLLRLLLLLLVVVLVVLKQTTINMFKINQQLKEANGLLIMQQALVQAGQKGFVNSFAAAAALSQTI